MSLDNSFNIRQATEEDIPALYGLYEVLGKKDDGYFEAVFEKECLVLMASAKEGGQVVGFGVLNFEPKYNLYQKLEIPEIQDLNVIPDARQQGVATMMVEAFENIARDHPPSPELRRTGGAKQIGISVGLTKEYGPAQRLYVKLGYQPDGNGITHDRVGVVAGQSYPVNDDLCLMMVKEL